MRRIIAVTVAFAVSFTALPLVAARAPQQTASLEGKANDAKNQPVPNTTVRCRNLQTGEIAVTTTSDSNGNFKCAGLLAGTYVVEVVSAAGVILASSAGVAVAAGAVVTGVAVTTSAVLAGAVAAGAGISTAVVVTTVAVGAGIAGAVAVAARAASPSR